MDCWALIPIKDSDGAKSRLAGALDPAERARLVEAMLAHVVAACAEARGVTHIGAIGTPRPDPGSPDPGRPNPVNKVIWLADPGGGLNAALQAALAEAGRAGAGRALVVAADLPMVTAQELDLLAAAPAGTVAIAPDRHGTGTNALSLPLPAAREFVFAFGEDSYARHRMESERLRLGLEEIHGPGLARDIDEPEDLPDAAGLLE